MPKVRIQALSSDTRSGTNSFACYTEEDAIGWLVSEVGQDLDEFDLWKEDHPGGDVWDFIELHRDDLDTFSWEEVDVDIPLSALEARDGI